MKTLKIIHAADLHLDSAFEALGAAKAALRRAEQRQMLLRVFSLVEEKGADLLLLAGMVPVWLYFMFGICQADLRVGGFFGLGLGAVGWEATAGWWLRPLFSGFWRLVARIFGFFLLPFKKFLEKTKIQS